MSSKFTLREALSIKLGNDIAEVLSEKPNKVFKNCHCSSYADSADEPSPEEKIVEEQPKKCSSLNEDYGENGSFLKKAGMAALGTMGALYGANLMGVDVPGYFKSGLNHLNGYFNNTTANNTGTPETPSTNNGNQNNTQSTSPAQQVQQQVTPPVVQTQAQPVEQQQVTPTTNQTQAPLATVQQQVVDTRPYIDINTIPNVSNEVDYTNNEYSTFMHPVNGNVYNSELTKTYNQVVPKGITTFIGTDANSQQDLINKYTSGNYNITDVHGDHYLVNRGDPNDMLLVPNKIVPSMFANNPRDLSDLEQPTETQI